MDALSALSGGCNEVSGAGLIGQHRGCGHYSYLIILQDFNTQSIELTVCSDATPMTCCVAQ